MTFFRVLGPMRMGQNRSLINRLLREYVLLPLHRGR